MSLLPYAPALWSRLCFGAAENESGFEPQTTPANAQEALEAMPSGSRFRVLERAISSLSLELAEVVQVAASLEALQVTDASRDRRLERERERYPTLWARFDASASRADLSSYTHLLSYGRLTLAPHPVQKKVEVVLLVAPTSQPVRANELPVLSRRV